MVLIIEYTQQELSKIKLEINDLKEKINLSGDSSILLSIEQTLKDSTSKFKESVQLKKLRKLRRDTIDYRNGKVYPWRGQPWEPRREKKQACFRERSFNTSGSSSEYQTDSDPEFLGRKTHDMDTHLPRQRHYNTQGAKHVEVEGEDEADTRPRIRKRVYKTKV